MDSIESMFKELTEAPGVSGSEAPVRALVRRYLDGLTNQIEQDGLGSVIARLPGGEDRPRIMLAGHMDEVGFMVRYITDATRFRWPLFRFGLFVWLGGLVIATTAGVLWNPRSFSVNPPGLLRDRIFLMTLAIVLTPLQCIAEELLFRTTLWRMLARRVKRPWIMSLASAIVFTIAHLANTEVQESPVAVLVLAYYALSGFLFMEMTWRLGGTEAAFGAHIANNIFLVLVANYVGSSLPGDPWFLQEGPVLWVDFIVLLLCSALILRRGKRYQYTALP